ncbi:MAG: SLC13 family permease [Anaerolineales bacterium]|jgi:Na+/H+ antiporter NhaD/arsenite permease-like protein
MTRTFRTLIVAIFLLGCATALTWYRFPARAQESSSSGTLFGEVRDSQNQPVVGAQITLRKNSEDDPIAQTSTQPDGSFALSISNSEPSAESYQVQDESLSTEEIPNGLMLNVERAHFDSTSLLLEKGDVQTLKNGQPVVIPTITLQRHIGPAFWIASVIFVIVLILIATSVMHNTLAALVGATLIYLISYLGNPLNENLFIFNFLDSLEYIDWNVIFLIMGMMIVIAVVEKTGVFQWMAFFAYRISGGRMWLLLPILMLITGVASAFLDNVTTMLLMTPISVQIALALNINPLALLMPEVFASNVIGISTLIGTPTNILIGSFANISFNGFLINLTPGVLMAFIGLVIYNGFIYRKELAESRSASPALMETLEQRGRITQPEHLKKAGVIGAGMLILFIFGERIHLLPAVTALVGATGLLVWIRPDIEEMIEAVDWTTLVFFMALFIVVGAIQEVGLISLIADVIGRLVGDNLMVTMLAITWLSAILSMVVANIPFTAAMLPVVGFLSATVPGANNKVLFFCLSVGSAMGGNGSLIGASANMITAGISERAGYPITYIYFLKKGFPALVITVGLAMIWLFIHF